MIPTPDEDRYLLNACITGNRKSLEAFVVRFSGLVYRTVQKTFVIKQVPFSEEDIEDVYNSVFLKFFEDRCKKLRQFEGKNGCTVSTWISLVTARIAANYLRKKGFDSPKGRKKLISLSEINDLKSDEFEVLYHMERQEKEELLRKEIDLLSPRDRLFLKLYLQQEMSLKEIAETMRLSTDNIYAIKHRIIDKLKRNITSQSSPFFSKKPSS